MSLLGRGLFQLVVGVEVVLPQSRELPLQDEGRLVHLGPVHLALDQPVRQRVGLALQLVNFLSEQAVLVLQPLQSYEKINERTEGQQAGLL